MSNFDLCGLLIVLCVHGKIYILGFVRETTGRCEARSECNGEKVDY